MSDGLKMRLVLLGNTLAMAISLMKEEVLPRELLNPFRLHCIASNLGWG